MDIVTLKDTVKDLVKEKVGKVSNAKIDAVFNVTASEVTRRLVLDDLVDTWTKTLAVGTPNYTPPDNFHAFITLHCGSYEIQPVGHFEYQRWYKGEGSTGTPRMGTILNGQLWLYRIPGSALSMVGVYQKKLEYLKEVPDEFVDLFVNGMEARCYLPGTPERAEAWANFQRAITQKYSHWKYKPYMVEQSPMRQSDWARINDLR